jgi:hypothetical protein
MTEIRHFVRLKTKIAANECGVMLGPLTVCLSKFKQKAASSHKKRWEHDVRLALDVDEKFTFYSGENNILDEKHAFDQRSYPISSGVGRFLYVGAKVSMHRHGLALALLSFHNATQME